MNPPRTIGQYRTTERLATGGAGEVYAGIDTKVGREVAIKFLRPELASDPSFVDRFLAEAKSFGRLNHPNIATLYALPQEDDHVCMIMELVRGRTAEQIIQDRHGPLGIRESSRHSRPGRRRIVLRPRARRDLSRHQAVEFDGHRVGRVKIMDFGIARVRGSDRMTRAGSAVGTPLYMSPEQCRGLEGDERSDIYSLAVVLYELLAGAPPFKGTTDFELTKAHLGTPPPPLIPRIAGVEPPLESAIMTALSKRPEQRFPSMRSFSDATGATALRGDATGIVQSYIRPAQGQGATHEPPKRAPLHTVMLALVRSRAAAIARRFRGLHPGVQGVSVVGAVALAIAAAVLLRPEFGPMTDNQKPESRSLNDGQDGKQRRIPATLTYDGQVSPPPAKAQTGSASVKRSLPPCNTQFATECDPDPPQQQQSKVVEQKLPPQEAAVNNQEAKTLDAADDRARDFQKGLRLLHGDSGYTQDVVTANRLIYGAANNGYVPAMLALGKIYYNGDAGDKDPDLARDWFKRAAGAGNTEAMYFLGEMGVHNEAGLHRRDAKNYCHMAWDKPRYPQAKQCLQEIHERIDD